MIERIARAIADDIARHAAWYSLAAMAGVAFVVEIARERIRVATMIDDLVTDLDSRTDAIAARMTPAVLAEHDARTSITDADVREIAEGRYRG
jgi:hypothetical protein